MTIKTILVHLDELPRCTARIKLAAQLALRYEAHLVGLSPTGLIAMPAQAGFALGGSSDYIQLSFDYLERRALEIVNAFRIEALKHGVSSCEARVEEAEPLPAMAMHAPGSDLVIVGQTDPAYAASPAAGDFPQQVVMHAGRPVLVVPYAGNFETVGRHVFVAWSPTRESSRALGDALPFLERAEKVHVIYFASSEAAAEEGRVPLDRTLVWLGRHGVPAEGGMEITSIDVGNALLSRATDFGADLMVMGCYGHSRLKELMLGGVTRTVLASMTVPVLMSH